MIDGERAIQKTLAISAQATGGTSPTISQPTIPGFCNDYIFQVLADNSGVPAQNDTNTVIWWFPATTSAATITMSKLVNNSWVIKKTISDNTYGTYSSFGTFINNQGQKFIYLQINWASIINDGTLGAGSYKFTVTYTDSVLGNGTLDSYNYILNTYSALRADGWIRLEYWLSGITEDVTNDTLIKDFGTLSIYNNIRVRGYFGYPKSQYKTDTIEYDNGQEVWVEDRREPEYLCQIKMTQQFIHNIIQTDFMMSDRRAITDYNSRNADKYITKYIMKGSGYEPEYYPLQSLSSPVNLKFKPESNRSRKFRI